MQYSNRRLTLSVGLYQLHYDKMNSQDVVRIQMCVLIVKMVPGVL